jgi:hypothetical protein
VRPRASGARPDPIDLPIWVSLLGGAGAGATVVGFLAVPWPTDLLVVPLLAVWVLVLTAVPRPPRGRAAAIRAMALVGLIAVALALAAIGLMAQLP